MPATERRTAVIDMGSNTFRLVVFTAGEGGWWKRTDEIYDAVRVGAGMEATGALEPQPMARALRTLDLYAQFCRAAGLEDVRPVATSAIRDASNREEFLARAATALGREVRVLSGAEEGWYGCLAALNSTTLEEGAVLDLGGGSLQLSRVTDRRPDDLYSWPLGAVRMTERFLPGSTASKKELKALRAHVRKKLAEVPWLAGDGRLVGIGGAVRNIAAASALAAELPIQGVQGHLVDRAALDELVAELASRPASERGKVPGIKPERGDVILAAAVTIQAVLEAGNFEGIEATEAGLREGVFFSTLLDDRDPPVFADVRRESVLNLARQYRYVPDHVEHVARLALDMFDALAAAGVHAGDASERELLWAAAMLHDIGTVVDYDDHHKHSRYLILNAGLPGFSPREAMLVAQIARYHRKGAPGLGPFAALARSGDCPLVKRCSALLRLAEHLDRSRDQSVRAAHLKSRKGAVELRLEADADISLARWEAERQRDLFEKAFGEPLAIVA
jgi:exopolyphosphatase/guanosine-5'-triphosphate,3'-diphosphate pyrophosphatase